MYALDDPFLGLGGEVETEGVLADGLLGIEGGAGNEGDELILDGALIDLVRVHILGKGDPNEQTALGHLELCPLGEILPHGVYHNSSGLSIDGVDEFEVILHLILVEELRYESLIEVRGMGIGALLSYDHLPDELGVAAAAGDTKTRGNGF